MNREHGVLQHRVMGEGRAVVFLHPTPLDGEFWRPVVERLAGVRAILPDLRGHGASPLGAGLPVGRFALVPDAPALTMEILARDVLALLDALAVPEAVFVGCSVGGSVLLELWRQAPERVRGLGFVCSKPQADTAGAQHAATIAKARAGERAEAFDAMARALTGATAQKRHPERMLALRARMNAVTAEALEAMQAGLALRQDSLPTVATMTVPVFALAGGEDAGTTIEQMRAFEGAPGGCSFHAIDDAGHFAAYEQPERVAALLQEWLATIKA